MILSLLLVATNSHSFSNKIIGNTAGKQATIELETKHNVYQGVGVSLEEGLRVDGSSAESYAEFELQ